MDKTKTVAGALLMVAVIMASAVFMLEPADATEQACATAVFGSDNLVTEECDDVLFVSAYRGTAGVLGYVHKGVVTDLTICSAVATYDGDYLLVDTGLALSHVSVQGSTLRAQAAVAGGYTTMVLKVTFTTEDGESVEPSYSLVGNGVRIGFPAGSFLSMTFSLTYEASVTYNSNSSEARMGVLDPSSLDEDGRLQTATSFRTYSDYLFFLDGCTIASWNTESDGTGISYGLFDLIPEGATVYAQWC